jgi:hypothetical protein
MGAAMLEPLTFRGLPLSALRQPDVRRRCIETFLRALQRAVWKSTSALGAPMIQNAP